MIVDLIATGVLAAVPALVGAVVGVHLRRYRIPLLVLTGVPAVYFAGNLLIALERQGLDETVLVGIPLGESPVFVMLLSAVAGGTFLGLAAAGRWPER